MGQLSASDKAKLLSFGAPKAKLTSSGVEPVALALPGAPPRPALAGAASTNLSLKAASLKLREERRKDDRPDKQVTAAGLQMVTESITRLDRRERPEDSDFDLQVLVSRAAKYLKSSTLEDLDFDLQVLVSRAAKYLKSSTLEDLRGLRRAVEKALRGAKERAVPSGSVAVS